MSFTFIQISHINPLAEHNGHLKTCSRKFITIGSSTFIKSPDFVLKNNENLIYISFFFQ
jgi:hypothetical protein